MPSPYATVEDPKSLWYEQSIHASTHLGAMAYGMLITVYYLAIYYGLKQKRISWWWMIYNTGLVMVATVNIATSIHYNETAWIDERNYPGGPYRFLIEQQNRPVMTVGNSAYIFASAMAEGLLLYRVFIIWQNRWYITIFATLFFLINTALSIVTVIQLALPFSPTWARMPRLEFPVWMMWIVLNIVLTFLLAGRLLYLRRKLRRAMGKQYGKTYTSVVAMIVESALPFSILSVMFLVIYGRKDPTQNLFIQLLVQVECLSPMLIILRVIRGRAWCGDTVPDSRATATLEFTGMAPSSGTDGTETSSGNRLGGLSEFNFKHRSDQDKETGRTDSTINAV